MLEKSPRIISLSVHLIAVSLIPSGVLVALSKLPQSDTSVLLVNCFVFLVMALIYFITDYFLKSNLFTIATYIFGTISYFNLVTWIGGEYSLNFRAIWTFSAFYGLTLAILPWILVLDFRKQTYRSFEGAGYLVLFSSIFGIVFDTPLEILALFIYTAGIFLGSYVKSAAILTFSFLAITSYILYVNGRYFTDLIGWPVGLILSGFILILSGYIFSKMNKNNLPEKL
jgi:hypothetical protein